MSIAGPQSNSGEYVPSATGPVIASIVGRVVSTMPAVITGAGTLGMRSWPMDGTVPRRSKPGTASKPT